MPRGCAGGFVLFQPTPPRRGRPSRTLTTIPATGFQPTPPRRGRPLRNGRRVVRQQFQPTPPRRGRLSRESCAVIRLFISTHAPAQGATGRCEPSVLDHAVFQPTPPRRGRPNVAVLVLIADGFQPTPPRRGRQRERRLPVSRSDFNPRPRAGGDHGKMQRSRRAKISTHAPAQGATRKCRRGHPRPEFQPTPPRRGRQVSFIIPGEPCGFQPTPPRRGRRDIWRRMGVVYVISTHAPAQGATTWLLAMTSRGYYFNPRPRAGGDLLRATPFLLEEYFNPRPRAGGDPPCR